MGQDSKRSKKYRSDDRRQDRFRKGRQELRPERKECAMCVCGKWVPNLGRWVCTTTGDCLEARWEGEF